MGRMGLIRAHEWWETPCVYLRPHVSLQMLGVSVEFGISSGFSGIAAPLPVDTMSP